MPLRNENWRKGEKENNKVSGSVYRLWSLGLVYLQSVRCLSHLALISAAPWSSSYWARWSHWTLATVSLLRTPLSDQLRPGRARPPESCSFDFITGLRAKGEQAPPRGPESQPHPDKQMGLKRGPLVCENTKSFLDKEKTSWQSHLNDVDRWHPIVVVVLGELWEQRRRWQVWEGWRTHRNHTISFFNEHEDASWCL